MTEGTQELDGVESDRGGNIMKKKSKLGDSYPEGVENDKENNVNSQKN